MIKERKGAVFGSYRSGILFFVPRKLRDILILTY